MGSGYCDLLIQNMKWFSFCYAFIHQIVLEINKKDIDPVSIVVSQEVNKQAHKLLLQLQSATKEAQ